MYNYWSVFQVEAHSVEGDMVADSHRHVQEGEVSFYEGRQQSNNSNYIQLHSQHT